MPRLASLIAVVALLTSCSAGGAAPRSPTPPPRTITTRPATATPTTPRTGPLTTGPNVRPGESPPTLNSVGREHTSFGATIFAEYYVHAFDWTIATNDAYLVEQVSGPACAACQRVVAGVDNLRTKGQHLRGGRISVAHSRIVIGKYDVHSDWVVRVDTQQAAEQVVDAAGRAVSKLHAAVSDSSLVFVSWVTDRWQIVEVGTP